MSKTQKAKSAASNSFLPADYVTPNSSNNYMKFKAGENRLRFLDPPIFGWVTWEDKTPTRTIEQPVADDPDNLPKHFWLTRVYDYADNSVKILELTQASVQKAVAALNGDDDWGSPLNYDLKITKSGEALQTKYVVTPLPKKPLSKEAIRAAAAKPANLEAMYDGEDPFAV